MTTMTHRFMRMLRSIAFATLLTMVVILSSCRLVDSFFSSPFHQRSSPSFVLFGTRKSVCIPLLDLSQSEDIDKIVTPLPSSHLPSELATLNLYGLTLKRPVHKMLVDEAIHGGGEETPTDRVFGYIIDKPYGDDVDSLVGAIGCAVDVLLNTSPEDADYTKSDVGDDVPITVLCRGSYRFVVKDVVKTFPYPVGIVDELVDVAPPSTDAVERQTDDDDDDEKDEDGYARLDAPELVRRTILGLHAYITQKLDTEKPSLSPLEQSILQDTGFPIAPQEAERSQTEEMAAVLDVFCSSLIDIAPMPIDRYYAIGMMAAEILNVDNETRRQIISTRDGLTRLRIVLRELEAVVGMNQARKMANTITDEMDEDMKDLMVGDPQLPPWANSLQEGMRIEYFWNEAEGWCAGKIIGEPMKIVDELIVTVLFDDGETHRLPLSPHEKVRWRPAQ